MDKVLEAISDYRQEGTEGFQSDVNDFIDYMQEEVSTHLQLFVLHILLCYLLLC